VSTGFSAGPGSREPGLDQLIKALTAGGHPHELAGRDAALAAFRAASREPRRRARFSTPSWLRPTRLTTVAAALVAGLAGVTAAAYAQALPAPVQDIAHSVLSPIGVPGSQGSTSPRPSGTGPGPASGSATAGTHHAVSPSATCPCPTATPSHAIAGSVLVLTVGRVQLAAGGTDVISGELTRHGRPEPGVRVRLLEQAAGATVWEPAGTRVTGGHGRVRFGALRITRNAVFQLAVSGGADSARLSVTVLPHVRLRLVHGTAADRLVADVPFGQPGDTVVLEQLSGGTWQAVATQTLDSAHRATFRVPLSVTGRDYRVVLQATTIHGPGASALVWQAGTRSRTGAKSIVPATPQPTATPSASATATAAATGTASAGPTPSPTAPPASQPTPTPSSGLGMARAAGDGYPPRNDHEQEPWDPCGAAGPDTDDQPHDEQQ
jgi:hypothetical protein